MKTYKKKTVKVIDEICCDMCGETCTTQEPFMEHEYAKLEASWGYFSEQDGTQYDIEICEYCFNEVLGFIKEKRRKKLGPFKYPRKHDPLEGKRYIP